MKDEEQQQIKKIDQFVADKLTGDRTGHDYAHIERVVRMACRLSDDRDEKIRSFIVESSSLLHDVIDEKLVESQQRAEEEVRRFLTSIGVDTTDIAHIFDIITHMSFSKNLSEEYTLSLEGQIVQDADRLDAIGAIGIARTFYYGGAHEHIIYDPKVVPRTNMTHDEYRDNKTVINHFYEKLLLLVERMNTPLAKRIAENRTQYLQEFLDEFKAEWNQEK
ncbi:HD domain-containing protein [Pediococcus argentinicus]|uniref:HD superfamily hydrolase n=1 Tax=Pediococcus argentinicus TaxID=480391 RepID=A0A0R2NK04_9LACO|nr:HD domain-containing protein [Pediococcus argentinicus]KRO24656.1 HD superfamily hydrolase [Pediococcus argentinicus]NKZ22774.1 HD domain-containing protein [Pediococcus argentinicus]GEP19819.1 metal-dependent phosphohydrolase [Pediococcus argentinicus]